MSTVAILPPQASIQRTHRSLLPAFPSRSLDPFDRDAKFDCTPRNDGLLAAFDALAAFPSMPAYGKGSYSDAKDPNSTQSVQQAMYVAYAQPGVQPHTQTHGLPYVRQTNQVSYTAGPLLQSRENRSEQSAAYLSNGTRQVPEVSSWSPQQGPPGSRVFIFLVSAFELDPTWRLEVEFGTCKSCATTLRRIEPHGSYFQYALSAEVPSISLTGWANTQVPVTIVAHDRGGNEIASVKLAPGFTYTDGSISQLSMELHKKRRLSDESGGATVPIKRAATQTERADGGDVYENVGYTYTHQNTPTYHLQRSPHLALDTSVGNILPTYQRSQAQSAVSRQDSPQRPHQHISSTTPNSAPVPGRSPRTPSWSISNLNCGPLPKSPSIPGVANARVATVASPSLLTNPPLIRTSTLQQSPSPASTPTAHTTFNPYGMYPHKAVLKINGSLDSMTEGWSEEEREVKRRLVQFWRSQTGSTISTNFKPVAPEDRQPNSICISCIWWESRNEYYVTSVDTIYLLESLVAVRFTVEEKNRIRRNLEGFRPMTVSKGKSDSEDFFKLIMGFPNPKPRNIEKDVKVFPWKILSHALKKIISKYSASYSSTAGPALATSISSNFRAPQAQDLAGDLLPASPHSNAESSISVAYQSPLTATTNPSEVPQSQSASPFVSASHAVMATTMASAYPLYSYPQGPLNHSTGGLPVSAQPTSLHAQRPGLWEYTPFVEPTSVASGSGLYAVNVPSNDAQYPMVHPSSGA